jgi:methylmalonyl-CoA/ethylmalonyl-CoA epimerase
MGHVFYLSLSIAITDSTMIQVKRIDHVAIAVGDTGAAGTRLMDLFGLRAGACELVPDQQTEVMFLYPSHSGEDQPGTSLELVCPAGSPHLTRFLDRRGPGLHHICFEVDNLAGALAALKAEGVALVDEAPRQGARGHQVAFVHPKATGGTLVELCQKPPGDSP